MARRTSEEARQAAILEGIAKIRFALRNSEFRKDLAEVTQHLGQPHPQVQSSEAQQGLAKMIEEACAEAAHNPDEHGTLAVNLPTKDGRVVKTYDDLLQKYGLQWLPYGLVKADGTVADQEKILLETLQEDPQARERPPWRPAVVAIEPYDEWLATVEEDWDGSDQTVQPPADIPLPGTILNVQIDLSYPQYVIEAEFQTALRKAKERREKLETLGHVPPRPERLQLNTIQFQLTVYDLAKEGKTFAEIARSLNSHPSTVKSALLAASKKINGATLSTELPAVISKKALPLVDFDSDRHVAQCTTCSRATRLEDMCEIALMYVSQDAVSQRERPFQDPTGLAADDSF